MRAARNPAMPRASGWRDRRPPLARTAKAVGGEAPRPRPSEKVVYPSRSFALAARRRWRYVPSNTVSVSDVQVLSAASAGRLA